VTLPSFLSRGSLPKRTKVVTVAGSAFAAAASILIATRYTRAEPSPTADPPGLRFGSASVKLSSDAPAWSSISIDHPHRASTLWTDAITARITFDESRTSRVGAPLGGRITGVQVEAGQVVHVGTPLFTIASSNLAELHGDITKADIETRGARVNLDRTQSLVDAGSLPGKELVAAKQALAEAELASQLARQKVSALKITSSSDSTLTVVAPRDGVIVEKHLAVGQQVDVTTGDLVAIADLSSVWVLADLFETDATGVHVGAAAQVSIDDGATQRDATIEQGCRRCVSSLSNIPRIAPSSASLR
jgi:membrane fusion protein, heavy metal efflux system